MTAFDFSAAELEFEADSSLRERAAEAYAVEKGQIRAELLIAAHEMIHDVLDETNGTDLDVSFKGGGDGDIELTLDNIRFKVEVRHVAGAMNRRLFMRRDRFWHLVDCLSEVGKVLDGSPCYATRPEVDGRGDE